MSTTAPAEGTSEQELRPDGQAVMLTVAWMAAMLLWALMPGDLGISLAHYQVARTAVILLLLVITATVLWTAWGYIVDTQKGPWHKNGLLVAAAIFWALAPPVWFFVEYWHFDTGVIKVPASFIIECKYLDVAKCARENHAEYLKHVRGYADLASRIWAGAGGALAALLAIAKRA